MRAAALVDASPAAADLHDPDALLATLARPSAGAYILRVGNGPSGGGRDPGGPAIPTPADYSKRARRAAKAGDHSQAGDFYRLAGDWEKANQMYLQGGHFNLAAHLAQEMEDYAAASRYYVKAGDLKSAAEMELQRDNKEAAARLFGGARQHTHAAELYESLEQFEAAAQQYQRAHFHEKAASLYARAGKPEAAAALLEGIITTTGRDEFGSSPGEMERSRILRYHRVCGELLQSAGQHARAAAHYERALCLEAAAAAWQSAGELERAADLLLRLQRPEAAYALLRQAGRDLTCLPPEVQAAILGRGGRHREAAEVLERAGSHFAAAEAWAQAGELERAAALFEKEGDPERASQHYSRAGRPGEAARVLEAAGRPRRAAELYLEAERPEDAARMLQRANDPVAAAMIHYERGDHDAVIRSLQRLRPDEPGYRKASFLLGRVFFEQGLHTLAVDRFLAAIAGADVDAETLAMHYSLARAHEASRRPREAVSVYRRILSFDYHHQDVLKRMRALEKELTSAEAPAETAGGSDAPAGPARYRIETSLGIGKLGEVFTASDTVLHRQVALRRLHEGPGETGKAARFLREAAAAARLSHPNIVTTFDTGVDRQGAFIVSELADGSTLRSLLDRKVRFEVNRIVEIGRQILEALDHAHERGIPHRGLSPSSVFVSDDDHVVVGDFGLAIRLSDLSSEELASGLRVRYTPPETLLRQRVDERSDLYAFGILLYEMAVGHPPFRGAAVGHQHVHDPVPAPGPGGRSIPRFLKKVILRCLEKRREDRYPSARAVLEDLQVKEIVPGVIVADRYEVLAEVGRGGMGTVFRARDVELDETVALKFLSGRVSAETVARQVREIKIARAVVHPSVVRVFTLEKWGDHRFLVMEYIDGVSLPRWVERTPTPSREDRIRVGIQVARALHAAHDVGIIHRDIKPENILIDASGETKVLDFGIARSERDDAGETSAGTILGSPMYIAPERIQGRPLNRRSDLYALGAVLYFLLTGRDAFPGRDAREILLKHLQGSPVPPHEVDPSLPRPVSETILRCLALDPEARFASGAELAEALVLLLPRRAGESITTG